MSALNLYANYLTYVELLVNFKNSCSFSTHNSININQTDFLNICIYVKSYTYEPTYNLYCNDMNTSKIRTIYKCMGSAVDKVFVI